MKFGSNKENCALSRDSQLFYQMVGPWVVFLEEFTSPANVWEEISRWTFAWPEGTLQ